MQKKKIAVIVVVGLLATALGITEVVLRLKSIGPEKTPAFLPGVYTCVTQNEFCRIVDTLVIRRTKMEEDNYAVTRGTSFTRIRHGKDSLPEYQQQRWTGTYLLKRQWLVLNDGTDTVQYYPEKNRVSKANFYYEKVE